MKSIFVLLAACLTLIVGSAFGQMAPAEKNIIFNGDFEQPADKNPPPGWAIWGDKNAAKPENFARDANNPHGGKYCIRVNHPSGVHCYLVTDPRTPIETKKGMRYIVSFWARSDSAGPSIFYFEAASALPWTDAPSPGNWPIEVDKGWKQFKFEIQEGKDFRADQSKYLLLAFRPTRDKAANKMLWLDDIVVTEVKGSAEALIDESTLKYAPLNHRLQPGEKLEISIDADKRIGPTVPQAGGVSFHRITGSGRHPYDPEGKYVLEPQTDQALRDMKLPMTRFYAVGVEPFGLEGNIDKLADLCDKYGIPKEWTVIELEPQGAEKILEPADWARAAKHSLDKGYKFRYWEVANEPYTRKAVAFHGPDDYAEHLKAVSAAVKAVQKDAQIGIGINPQSVSWGNYLLKKAAGSYDFVVGHFYADTNAYKKDFTEVVLGDNLFVLDHILRLSALIKAYNPGRQVYLLDTEWGLGEAKPGSEGPEGQFRNSNVEGATYRTVRMIYYAREGMMRGASAWEMFARLNNPGFGHLTRDAADSRFMLYWVHYLFNRHVGKTALDISGTAPFAKAAEDQPAGPLTPVLASLSEDGRTMYMVIANASWDKAFPAAVNLAKFQAATAVGQVLSQADQDANPLVKMADKDKVITKLDVTVAPDKLSFTVPAHSSVFITVTAK